MRKFVATLVVAGLCVTSFVGGMQFQRRNSELESSAKTSRTSAELKLAVTKFIEEEMWRQSQNAQTKIPLEHKQDFVSLIRTIMNDDENGANTDNALKTFREKVFPGASDEAAMGWAFQINADDDLIQVYKRLATSNQEEHNLR